MFSILRDAICFNTFWHPPPSHFLEIIVKNYNESKVHSNQLFYCAEPNGFFRFYCAGYHSLRKQPDLPLDVRLDDAAEDLTAEADSGRDDQADVRGAPDDPGHARTNATFRWCAQLLPQGNSGKLICILVTFLVVASRDLSGHYGVCALVWLLGWFVVCLLACGHLANFPNFKKFTWFQKMQNQNVFHAILINFDSWTPPPPLLSLPKMRTSHLAWYIFRPVHLFIALFTSSSHLSSLHLFNFLYFNQFVYSSTYVNQVMVQLNHTIRWSATQCW